MATEEGGIALLKQLNQILSSDSLIDEVGYVHPSQLASLQEGVTHGDDPVVDPSVFWCAEHKLAISNQAVAPLYKAANSAFITTRKAYQTHLLESRENNTADSGNTEALESLTKELLSYSKALILLNPGDKTAWDVRKQVFTVSSTVGPLQELRLSSLVLSFNPKCEEAWAYRRWTLRNKVESLPACQIPDHLLEEEFRFVAMIADRSRMNYRAWRHCCWLVQWMSPSQMLDELTRWKSWAALHVAESSCFHFRRCLLQKVLMDDNHAVKVKDAWLEESNWNKELIKLYLGRETLWLHQRFLFFMSINNLKQTDGLNQSTPMQSTGCSFAEVEIAFANSCIASCHDDVTEDGQKQIVYASTFKLWVLWKCKECSMPLSTAQLVSKELNEIEKLLGSKAAFQKALWEGLLVASRTDSKPV